MSVDLESLPRTILSGAYVVPHHKNDTEPGYNPYGTHIPVVRYRLEDNGVLRVEKVEYDPRKPDSVKLSKNESNSSSYQPIQFQDKSIRVEFVSDSLPFTLSVVYNDVLLVEDKRIIVCVTNLKSPTAINKISLKDQFAVNLIMCIPTFRKRFKLCSDRVVTFIYNDLEFCVLEYSDFIEEPEVESHDNG